MLKFGKDDERISANMEMRRESTHKDGVVSDLSSSHKYMSESLLNTALDAVKSEQSSLFIKLLNDIDEYCKSEQPV